MVDESPQVSASQQDQIEAVKATLDEFKERLLDKFGAYVKTITLVPTPIRSPRSQEEATTGEAIDVVVIVDDTDSERMTKDELFAKLDDVVQRIATDVNDDLAPSTFLLSDFWQLCYDRNYDDAQTVINSAPVYDDGLLSALKVSETHKEMVLDRFEKYIVTYVLAGSVVQGRATAESDVDVFVVIDDTDVKQMSRAELKDKLRAIITGMSSDAAQAVGVENKLNIQVYILTDFWENVKQANPVIFTFLRDGVPLYDRGIFMAWKQLLEMGRIKPSPEAIDMFMNTGEQMLKKVDRKLREIGMEDFFWATVTTSQAAIMLYGLPPPTPKETPDTLRDIFVEKEGFLEDEDVDAVEKVLDIRKDLEHGKRNTISGEEIDELKELTKSYLDVSQDLFDQIQDAKNEERFEKVYDDLVEAAQSAVDAEGGDADKYDRLSRAVEDVLVSSGVVPSSVLHDFEEIADARERYESGDISKAEVNDIVRRASSLSRTFLEHVQRLRARESEQSTIRLAFGDDGRAELLFLEDEALLTVYDGEERDLYSLGIDDDGVGSVDELETDSFEERKKAGLGDGVITQDVLDDLSDIVGADVSLVV